MDPTDRTAAWLQRLGAGFDRQAVERLLALDPQEALGLMPQLLQAFEESLQTHLLGLQQALEQGDVQGCRRAAHAVRSASNSMGALEFAAACHALEKLAYGFSQEAEASPAVDSAGAPGLQRVQEQAGIVMRLGHQLLQQVRQAGGHEQA